MNRTLSILNVAIAGCDYIGVGEEYQWNDEWVNRLFLGEHTRTPRMRTILMQHKHTGMGYIDIMKDIQILDSVLTRQLLDSIYKINVRRKKIVKLTMAAIIKAL